MKQHTWKIVAALVLLLLIGAVVYSQQAAKKANEGITIEKHIKGNSDAKVELVEYSDFQCPACGQFYPYVKDIVQQYGDNLRFEYRHFPLIGLHQYAVQAAHASEAAAQQGKFWEMHDMLFENQDTWSKSSNPRAYFIEYAQKIGLDTSQFKLQMDAPVIDDAVQNSFNDARSRGFTGTPSFLLNGEKMEFQTFDEFKTQIKDAIDAAYGTTSTSTASE